VRRLAIAAATLVSVLAATGTASAAQLIDRDATGVRISLNAKGEALLTYRKAGAVKHVLVWGAINALAPKEGAHQQKFKLDYSGGWGKYHSLYWKRFSGGCGAYDGPALPNVVAACKAADGSYWAAQSWPQPLPDLGFTPWLPELRANWLEVSHWTGEPAKLEVGTNWVYSGRFQSLFGRVTYQGMASYWSTAHGEIADFMNSVPKIVFSRTLERAEWKNTRLVKENAAKEVARLKQEPGKDLFIFGSANLSSTLMRDGLIDEYRLGLTPVILGGGNPLFKLSPERMKLTLVEARPLKAGCVILRYQPEQTMKAQA